MWQKERENAVKVKVLRHIAEVTAIPPKGVWRFLGKQYPGMVVGFKGRQGPGDCMPYHAEVWLLPGGNCAPALIPLVQPGKGR